MTNANWTAHTQFDSDPRRNGKLRLIRNHTSEGESHVIASNVKPDVASLIAAAPDLLAALDELLADLDTLNEPYRNEAICERARAAITKAKGE